MKETQQIGCKKLILEECKIEVEAAKMPEKWQKFSATAIITDWGVKLSRKNTSRNRNRNLYDQDDVQVFTRQDGSMMLHARLNMPEASDLLRYYRKRCSDLEQALSNVLTINKYCM